MPQHHGKTPYLVASALVSLGLHALFFLLLGNVRVEALAPRQARPAEENRPFILHTDVQEAVFGRRAPRPAVNAAQQLPKDPAFQEALEEVKNIFQAEKLIEAPAPKLRLKGLGENLAAPPPAPLQPRDMTAPRPHILEIDGSAMDPERLAKRRPEPQLDRRNLPMPKIPSLVGGDGLQAGSGENLEAGMRLDRPKLPPLNLRDLPPGLLDDPAAERRPPGALPDSRGPEPPALERSEKLQSLDRLLDVSAVVLRDPAGGGYFRLDIRPNRRSDQLGTVPKDILFMIDSSLSITQTMHRQFKAATIDAFQALAPDDRFNIVSFRERPKPLFPDYLEATQENLRLAAAEVEKLQRSGMTDVFSALAPYVGAEERLAGRPLNIFLLSDGESTVSGKLDNQTFIRQIHSLNRNAVSIYSFSAGSKANRHLMDFLAYNNRGKSVYHRETAKFRDELMRFMSSHTDIIVADLKYNLVGGMEPDAFPKNMPHLYRGETLSVYGRLAAGATEIVGSLTGRSADGGGQELVFRIALDQAEAASAGLAAEWAAQKVVSLLIERTLHPEQAGELQTEINRLSARHRLVVPY